ncbi:MAG: hypothetical protein WC788_02180 [Candidatus Paceibacterota bacterium]|jgi:hypothetical protein
MYILNSRIYPFRGFDEHSFKDFGVITNSAMEYLLAETKTESPCSLMEAFNASFRSDAQKKQIMTSIIEIKTSKTFPFLKISKIIAS